MACYRDRFTFYPYFVGEMGYYGGYEMKSENGEIY
jgi:hypothetical protein